MLTEEQYHTKRKTWIAHIQLLTGDLHLKGKMSNVYNKKIHNISQSSWQRKNDPSIADSW